MTHLSSISRFLPISRNSQKIDIYIAPCTMQVVRKRRYFVADTFISHLSLLTSQSICNFQPYFVGGKWANHRRKSPNLRVTSCRSISMLFKVSPKIKIVFFNSTFLIFRGTKAFSDFDRRGAKRVGSNQRAGLRGDTQSGGNFQNPKIEWHFEGRAEIQQTAPSALREARRTHQESASFLEHHGIARFLKILL